MTKGIATTNTTARAVSTPAMIRRPTVCGSTTCATGVATHKTTINSTSQPAWMRLSGTRRATPAGRS